MVGWILLLVVLALVLLACVLRLGVADAVVPEPEGGAHLDPEAVFSAVDREIARQLARVEREGRFAQNRYEKFRRIGL